MRRTIWWYSFWFWLLFRAIFQCLPFLEPGGGFFCRILSQAPSQIFPAILAIPIVEKDRIHRARGIFADLFEDELATCEKGGAIAQRDFFSSRRKNHMANMTKLCQNHLPNHDQVDCWPYLVKTPRLGELAPFPSPVKKSKFQCICTVFNARITHTTKRNQYNPSYKTHGPYQIGSNEGCVG